MDWIIFLFINCKPTLLSERLVDTPPNHLFVCMKNAAGMLTAVCDEEQTVKKIWHLSHLHYFGAGDKLSILFIKIVVH
jgi:hypothetical protein